MRNLKRIAVLTLSLVIFLSSSLAIAHPFRSSAASSPGIQFNSNTCWHYATPNDYLCFSSTLYVLSENWLDNSHYSYLNFTQASFSSLLVPSQTFGTGLYGGNATITGIGVASVTYIESQAAGHIENMSFYYPSSLPVPTEVLVNGGSLASIPQAQYFTVFPTWVGTAGNNVFWNATGDYVEVKTSVSNAQITFLFEGIQITVYLNQANNGPKLASPDYILISYQSGGGPDTLKGEDGANYLTADPGSQITLAGVSGNPTSSQRFCLYECTTAITGTLSGVSTPQTFTYNYYTQFAMQMKDSGLPYPDPFLQTIGQLPQLTFYSGGASTRISLFSTYETVWMDDGTSWSVPNPGFIDLHYFNPSPATNTVTNSTSITISYAASSSFPSGGSCVSNNLFTLVLNTCLFSVFYYTWFNIFGSFGFGLILMGINLALYNKTENPNLIVLGMIIEGGVLGAILPQFFLPLATIFVVIGLSGGLYQVIRER